MEVTICLMALFNAMTHDTEEEHVPLEREGYIRKETTEDNEYYDLLLDSGEIACMDGETCEILEDSDEFVKLQEIDEQVPFTLSKKEFQLCATPCVAA